MIYKGNAMNQTEQMLRDALQSAISAMRGIYGGWRCESAIKLCEQALSHVKETPKNEHDSDDMLKREKLVRLLEEEISKIENQVWANTIDKGGLMDLFIQRFANALQDAWIKKNGGNE